MDLGEAKDFLFTLLTDQTPNIFKTVGPRFERLGTGGVDCASRVAIDQSAQANNGTQRFPRASKAPWAHRAHSYRPHTSRLQRSPPLPGAEQNWRCGAPA